MNNRQTAPLLALGQCHEYYSEQATTADNYGDHASALRFRYMAAGINIALQLMETFEGVPL